MPKFVPGIGNSAANLMIIGEAPGYYEDESGIPFCGPSGYLLDKTLNEVGLSRDDVYVTNVIKYRPPQNDFSRLAEVCDYKQQIDILISEINTVKPKCILALGLESVKALTGRTGIKMKDIRGSMLKSQYGPKVVCTYHPAALLRAGNTENADGSLPYWMRFIVKLDYEKAVKESQSRNWEVTQRRVTIARSSMDVYNFINRHDHKEYCGADIEALKCIPSMIAFAFSKYEAISIPLFRSLFQIELTTMPHSDLAECWKLIDVVLSGKWKKVGQNFKYDQDKLERLGFKVSNFHADTMLISHTLQPEFYKSLAFLTSLYTDQPYYKDEGKDFNPKKDKIDRLMEYNGIDSCVTLEIFLEQLKELKEEGLHDFYFNYVHLLHNLYLDIENQGLRIDYKVRNELKQKYQAKSKELLDLMKEILESYQFDASKFNPASPKQVALVLYDLMKIPTRQGTGEEILFSLLANVVKDDKRRVFIRSILDYRKSKKTETTYISAAPDYDKRMRTSYRIVGTETGRSSTAKLEPPIRPDKIGIALQTMTKHGDIGSELRSQYIPDDGFVFLECDLSQAEPRIVALLSNDGELMHKFDSIDIHSWTAELALNIPMNEIKKGSGERHIGKTLRNAGNYNVGKHEFMIHCNTMAAKYSVADWQDLSEWKCGKLLDTFHEFTPNVRKVFHKEVIAAIESTRTLINPYGRRRIFWGDLEDQKIFKEGFAQLPQSTVADHVKHAMLDAKKEADELQILLEMHDAFLCQVPKNDVYKYAQLITRLLERPIDFSNCTLKRGILYPKADCEVGDNWRDLKGFKL